MRRDRDRDVAIDRMLAAGLQDTALPAEACPEAGDLAAFVEGGLSGAERHTLEQHAAGCARCRHALALLGSTLSAAAPATVPRGARLPAAWLRWALPVAGVAMVVLLYVSIRSSMIPPPAPGAAAPMASKVITAEPRPVERRPAPIDANAPKPPTITARTRTGAPSTATRDKGRPTSAAAPAAGVVAEQIADAQIDVRQNPAAQVSPGIAGNAAVFRQQAPIQQAPVQQAPGQQAVAQQTPAQQTQRNVLDRTQGVPGGVAGGVVGGIPEPPPKAAVSGQMSLAETVQIVTRSPAGKPMLTIVIAPGRSVLWRLEANGTISRSRDNGVTWDVQSYRATASLLAGSAPSANVCWLVGTGGLVLLSTDGERWEPRPFPEHVDLVAIEARDALHATLTTRDGRRFVTDDGGASWR